MYRHFRLTPYTNHYKNSAFQDSRLEFVSLFPRVDTRLIPTNVLHATYLRYLHIIYMLHTILKHTTNISCKSTPLHHNIPYTQHTKHTPSSSIHFFILFVIIIYYIIIIYLFFLPSFIIIIIIIYYYTERHTNNTLTPISLPHQRTRHPTHSPPYTYVQTIFITSLLYANTMYYQCNIYIHRFILSYSRNCPINDQSKSKSPATKGHAFFYIKGCSRPTSSGGYN